MIEAGFCAGGIVSWLCLTKVGIDIIGLAWLNFELLSKSMNRSHQRIGAVSNAHVGAAFEEVALEYFRKNGIALTPNFSLPIGLSEKKEHCFDLGASSPKVLVECKSHRWTEGAKVPSAKMSVWNEAMFYFLLVPRGFRKILFVLHDRRKGTGESLVSYYRRTYSHLIPEDVEFLEFDESSGEILKE